MKKLVLISLLSLVSMTATAQTAPSDETATIIGAMPRIELPTQIHRMDSDEFYKFRGSYDLSNGKTLSLYNRGLKMYGAVDNQERHEIVATSANAFVALDRQMKMRIDFHDDGSVGGELVMVVSPRQHANGNPIDEQFTVVALH